MIDFLQGDYKHIVEGVRASTDDAERKRLKAQLPCATISGLFSPTREKPNLVEHSGAICIDIDKQDNPDVDFAWLKRKLCSLKEAAYVSYSASGKGLFVIIPIVYPHLHKEHFNAIKKDFFDELGIVIDKNCNDVTRLRLATYDAEPYINYNATPYAYTRKDETPKHWHYVARYLGDGDVEKQVEWLVSECERNCLDLTDDYDNWYKVGFSLTTLGEVGRGFYHRLSRMSAKYNHRDCDRKFNQLMGRSRKIGIDFLFSYLAMWGIELPDDFNNNKNLNYD